MSDHLDSTVTPKSLGELTGNIVDALKARRAIAGTIEDIHKARAIVQTVWLALGSKDFGEEDVNAVYNTLSEAWEVLNKIHDQVWEFNEAELADEIARRAAR